jgi:hypothetical protein
VGWSRTFGFEPGYCSGGFAAMFFLFSNRLGCLGSLLLSAVVTIGLLLMFGVLRF